MYVDASLVSASCTRLIGKARSHLNHLVPGGGPRNELPYRESTVRVVKQFCVDPMGMSFMDPSLERLALLAFDAAIAASATISEASRKASYREAAQRQGDMSSATFARLILEDGTRSGATSTCRWIIFGRKPSAG